MARESIFSHLPALFFFFFSHLGMEQMVGVYRHGDTLMRVKTCLFLHTFFDVGEGGEALRKEACAAGMVC